MYGASSFRLANVSAVIFCGSFAWEAYCELNEWNRPEDSWMPHEAFVHEHVGFGIRSIASGGVPFAGGNSVGHEICWVNGSCAAEDVISGRVLPENCWLD